MITSSDMAAEVAGRLKLSSTDVTRFKIYDSLDEAQTHLLTHLDMRHLTEAIKTGRLPLVKDIVLYQYPSDFIRWGKLWLNYTTEIPAGDPANIGKPARLVGDLDIVQTNRHLLATTTYPSVSQGTEGGYEIRPKPTADQAKGRRIRYIWKFPTITANQNCLFRASKRNLMVFFACMVSALVDDYSRELFDKYDDLFTKEVAPLLPKKEVSDTKSRARK